MLTDPQTITINTVAKTCAKILSTGQRSEYATADGLVKFTCSHQAGKKRMRRMMRIDQKVIAADPLTAENDYQTLGVYLVIDEPEVGFSDADIDYVVEALKTWATVANIGKICGGES